MCQQVLTTCPEAECFCCGIGDAGIHQTEVLLGLVVAHLGIEMIYILHAQRCQPLVLTVVDTQETNSFRSGHYFFFHMQVRCVGIDVEVGVDRVFRLQFDTPVLYFTRVHILHLDGLDEVVGLDIKEVGTIGKATIQTVTPRQFVVPQALRLQVFVCRLIEKHLLGVSTAETLADHCLHLACSDGADDDTSLRNPFATSDGVVVVTHSGIYGEPVGQVLAEVHITGNAIGTRVAALHQTLWGGYLLVGLAVGIVGTTIEMLVVNAHCGTVASKQLG